MAVDLTKVPSTPGVYKFFNNKEIIYIGKAKNLKKRVTSYFGNSVKDRKTSQIKFLTDNIETFTTKNEVEALLLEQMLIKENKPRFNILLRDDKTYPYIYFSLDHAFPGVYSKRTRKAVNSNYFGPFVSSGAVKKSIKDAYRRLLQPSLETEYRTSLKQKADEEAINVFAENLRQLLLFWFRIVKILNLPFFYLLVFR